MLQLEFVRFKELERLTRIKAGISADVETRLKRGRILEELLKQDANRPVSMLDQVLTLFALQNGVFEKVEPVNVRERLAGFLAHVHIQRPDLLEELANGKVLNDRIREGLNEQVARFIRPAL
jgi:F-type H+-transporting ATPase subunit alpha